METAHAMVEAGGGWLRLVALAPEIPGMDPIIEYFLSQGITVAAAHSDNNYKQAMAAYAKGIDIIFVAADRKMTRAELTAMASRSVREFKGRFGIDRAMPVGAVLDYQKDAASDTRTRFVLKLR